MPILVPHILATLKPSWNAYPSFNVNWKVSNFGILSFALDLRGSSENVTAKWLWAKTFGCTESQHEICEINFYVKLILPAFFDHYTADASRGLLSPDDVIDTSALERHLHVVREYLFLPNGGISAITLRCWAQIERLVRWKIGSSCWFFCRWLPEIQEEKFGLARDFGWSN